MKIVLASRNKNKIREIETLLNLFMSKEQKFEVLSLDDIGYSGDILENGSTFEENALIKAKVASDMGYISIADDSGLEVDYINGRPGVYSARYSGGGDCENNKLLLKELDGVPYEKRTARFVSVVACIFPLSNRKLQIVARGDCEGKILTVPRGYSGFGYDPLFYYEPLDKTFAELTADEKNSVSHRGIAMRKFAEVFIKKAYEKCN